MSVHWEDLPTRDLPQKLWPKIAEAAADLLAVIRSEDDPTKNATRAFARHRGLHLLIGYGTETLPKYRHFELTRDGDLSILVEGGNKRVQALLRRAIGLTPSRLETDVGQLEGSLAGTERLLEELIAALSPGDRRPATPFTGEGITLSAAAKNLGKPEQTVRRYIRLEWLRTNGKRRHALRIDAASVIELQNSGRLRATALESVEQPKSQIARPKHEPPPNGVPGRPTPYQVAERLRRDKDKEDTTR